MTAFTENEQWESDYNLFLIDNQGEIALLCHVGWRLLPPTIAKSKENLEKVEDYFLHLTTSKENYTVCPDLKKHLDTKTIADYGRYVYYFGDISSKGIYTYDSYDFSLAERPYYRVTIPKKALTLNDLPEEIKSILEDLKLDDFSFGETSLIPEDIVSKL